jgi:uncharacterized membrane protein
MTTSAFLVQIVHINCDTVFFCYFIVVQKFEKIKKQNKNLKAKTVQNEKRKKKKNENKIHQKMNGSIKNLKNC